MTLSTFHLPAAIILFAELIGTEMLVVVVVKCHWGLVPESAVAETHLQCEIITVVVGVVVVIHLLIFGFFVIALIFKVIITHSGKHGAKFTVGLFPPTIADGSKLGWALW